MQFWTYGPFACHPTNKRASWTLVRATEEEENYQPNELRHAIDYYVFVMKRGEKLVPWYVGKTKARTGF